jgi:predicted nucleic acid-binding protein
MIGLDCNILVQLAMTDHPASARTIEAVRTEIKQGTKLIVAPLVATEFLHIVTDERRFAPPLSMTEALDWLKKFLAHPSIEVLTPSQASLDRTTEWMRPHHLGRKRILDTHLAAILQVGGVRRLMTSNPRDFATFAAFEILIP